MSAYWCDTYVLVRYYSYNVLVCVPSSLSHFSVTFFSSNYVTSQHNKYEIGTTQTLHLAFK